MIDKKRTKNDGTLCILAKVSSLPSCSWGWSFAGGRAGVLTSASPVSGLLTGEHSHPFGTQVAFRFIRKAA
jgi:hypothetical protein